MTVPFYVSPEQMMKDRADYARKGIARGRSVVVTSCHQGILFVAENPSSTLHKISEIYDRIGFAAVGKYTEFEHLRVAGIRYADMRGYAYDRSDVSARALANAYAQTLGTVFTTEHKPFEVEIVVAQVGSDPGDDQLYRLTYDGSVSDEDGVVTMGGAADTLAQTLRDRVRSDAELGVSLRAIVAELEAGIGLEVALLNRTRQRRAFRRILGRELDDLLAGPDENRQRDDIPDRDGA